MLNHFNSTRTTFYVDTHTRTQRVGYTGITITVYLVQLAHVAKALVIKSSSQLLHSSTILLCRVGLNTQGDRSLTTSEGLGLKHCLV